MRRHSQVNKHGWSAWSSEDVRCDCQLHGCLVLGAMVHLAVFCLLQPPPRNTLGSELAHWMRKKRRKQVR